jgi:hypothetical protein
VNPAPIPEGGSAAKKLAPVPFIEIATLTPLGELVTVIVWAAGTLPLATV